VTEHVRQIPDPHRAAELLGAGKPGLEVAQGRLPVDEELVHERLPWSDRQASRVDERPDAGFRLRPDLQVVVDCRKLAVEGEAQLFVRFELCENLVDDVDERDPERLERPVPLPVPVRVRDEEDAQVLTEPARRPCTK
jgi:hypothetical protein